MSLLYKTLQAITTVFGRTIEPEKESWITGPLGDGAKIGTGFHRRYAEAEGWRLQQGADPVGLMNRFDQMNGPHFDAARVHPAIADFYEKTTDWDFAITARWNPLIRPFASILMQTVSRRIEQLNFPMGEADTRAGMSSELFPYTDGQGRRLYTCWLRTLPSSGRIIYAGFYTPSFVPRYEGGIVKTVFPLPSGHVTVILYPEALPDGSFRFVSKGNVFGGAGYYRVHRTKKGKTKVLQVPMSETLHLKPKNDRLIEAEHRFFWWNIPVLTLRFSISNRSGQRSAPAACA